MTRNALSAIWLAALAAGCSAPTGIDLTVGFPARLTDLRITGADSMGGEVFPRTDVRLSPSEEDAPREGNVVLRLSDELSDTVVTVQVDGLDGSDLLTRDETQVTLQLGELVPARVDLVVTLACQDGITQTATEQCDDGNDRAGDGCSPDCEVEPGWACTPAAPSLCQNSPPVAVADEATVPEDDSVRIDVVRNDTDVAGDHIVLDAVGAPMHGLARVESSSVVVYEPERDFNGDDAFTYEIVDVAGNRVQGTVDIMVTPVNDPPTAVSASARTELVEVQLTLQGEDVDNDPLEFSIASGPSNGTAALAGDLLTYRPAVGFVGQDTLTFEVSDRQLTATGTVTVDVTMPADWFDTDWGARRKLTFDNRPQTEDLERFPVLVVLDPSRIDYSLTAADGADLRFLDPAGPTPLPHQVESWTPGGTSFVWVSVPRIDGGSDTDSITMYYGHPAAPNAEAPEQVWRGSYEAVWHMNADLDDSTRQLEHWTDVGTSPVAGRIATGRGFAAPAHAVQEKIGLTGDVGTVSLWVSTSQLFASDTFLFHATEKDSEFEGFSDKELHLGFAPDGMVRFHTGGGMELLSLESPGTYNDDAWHHVAVTWLDQATAHMYVDGVEVDAAPYLTKDQDFSGGMDRRVWLSSETPPAPPAFQGALDEVRTATRAHSADWLRAQQASMSDDSFVLFGPELRIR